MYTRVIALCVASLAGCAMNESGNVSATKTGDVSNPAERRSPIEPLRAACGDGSPTPYGAKALKRQPYLQQVTSSSAMVGWVAAATNPAQVTVTDPEGTVLATAPAVAEPYSLRTAGEQQMWTSLDALEPGRIYCYHIDGDAQALNARTGFRTAPMPDSSEPVRFLAFGDSGGGGSDQYALMEQMYTVPHELMIHTGDIAYDEGTITQYEQNVFGVYSDLFRNIPFFPAAGNHDYKTNQGAPFREVFNLPGDSDEKWYSFDWGRVHFVALDTEASYATQAAWLDRDLAATRQPWKIVYLHRPPYSSGTHGSDRALREALAPVLERHEVQLVLAGHDHNYERMIPQGGTAYVVTGGGGVGTRSVGSSSFTAFSEDVIHFVYGEVYPEKLVLHAIDATGREFDSMVIPRS